MDAPITLAALGSATTSTAVDVPGFSLDGASLQVDLGAPFVATFQLEISVDGTNYVVAKTQNDLPLSGLTAGGHWVLGGKAKKMRVTTTAWTSGTVTARFLGGPN